MEETTGCNTPIRERTLRQVIDSPVKGDRLRMGALPGVVTGHD